MTSNRPEGGDALVAPLYFLAFLLAATPVLDFLTSILPFRTGDLQWRFASVGLLSGFLLTPLLGVALAMAVAHFARHLRVQRLMAIVSLSISVLFVLLMLAFLLDILQLRNSVQPEARAAFAAASTKAVVKHLSFVVALGWLSWTGFKLSSWSAPARERPPAAIVVG